MNTKNSKKPSAEQSKGTSEGKKEEEMKGNAWRINDDSEDEKVKDEK